MAKFIYPKEVHCSQGMYEFKKTLLITSSKDIKINIFAATRYILYINGKYVCEGPCRSSENLRFFDSVTTDAMKIGENEICVRVLHMSSPRFFRTAFKTQNPMLIAEIKTDSESFATDASWECCFLRKDSFIYSKEYTGFYPPFEEISDQPSERLELAESNDYDFDKSFLSPYGIAEFFDLRPRPIPMIYPGESIKLEPVKKGEHFIEYDAGSYITAKLSFDIAENTDVKIIYSECYEFERGKAKRDDRSGFLKGQFDLIHAQRDPFIFETFWFRAFRFIRIEADNPETAVKEIRVNKIHYPLDISGKFICSDENYNKMNEISVNTILCCLHEIMVDCPFYEQQQYIMDSAIESAVIMRMSQDTRPIKKCISEFAASQLPNGLLLANYPSCIYQVIPGFSFFFVFLLKDYLEYSKDTAFAAEFTGTIEKIFTYFENHLNDDRLISRSEYWDFVDLVSQWKNGIPNVNPGEALTVYNLYYACALQDAVYICNKVGKDYLAAEYSRRHDRLIDRITKVCYDSRRNLFKDGSETEEYSMHTIIWAILADAVTGDKARKMVEHLFDQDILKSSFSMNFYLFRALEKCGCYDYALKFFKGWQDMIDMHCTTWCERPGSPRSECHGWSSAPLYEFSANILGVKNSFEDVVTIAPTICNLTYAKGTVPTRMGLINVDWKVCNGVFTIGVESPDGIEKKVVLPNGETKYSKEKTAVFSCKI